jgi:hypothetical protein
MTRERQRQLENDYAEGAHRVRGVTVRRFANSQARDLAAVTHREMTAILKDFEEDEQNGVSEIQRFATRRGQVPSATLGGPW